MKGSEAPSSPFSASVRTTQGLPVAPRPPLAPPCRTDGGARLGPSPRPRQSTGGPRRFRTSSLRPRPPKTPRLRPSAPRHRRGPAAPPTRVFGRDRSPPARAPRPALKGTGGHAGRCPERTRDCCRAGTKRERREDTGVLRKGRRGREVATDGSPETLRCESDGSDGP